MKPSNLVVPERLHDRMTAAGHNQSSLAREVGVKQQSIGKLLGETPAGTTYLHKIAEVLGTTAGYLTGATDDPTTGALPRPTPELLSEQLDLVQIPVLDLRFGMGGGGFADESQEPTLVPMAREYLRLVTSTAPEKLKLAIGIGDSMYPTIHDRDALFIDTSQRTVQMSDQIWALYHHGLGMVKRLRATAQGIMIVSDNPHVSDELAAEGALHIEGRVVGTLRRI